MITQFVISGAKFIVPQIIANLCTSEIKNTISTSVSSITNYFTYTMTITNRNSSETFHAVEETLKTICGKKYGKAEVNDGDENINYTIEQGTYTIYHDNKKIYVTFSNDKIELWNYSGLDTINAFKNKCVKKFESVDDSVVFYMNELTDWMYPIYRRFRQSNNITGDMQLFIDDVNDFCNESDNYKQLGLPYKKGYFIEGVAGTGKTASIEIIASKHNRSIYSISLNSEGMTDSVLINLINKVKNHSIIIIDEFEKQYETVMRNPNSKLSNGGILNALDGICRLSHGTIIVLICNDSSGLPTELFVPLLRPGRLDKKFVFNEQFI